MNFEKEKKLKTLTFKQFQIDFKHSFYVARSILHSDTYFMN